MDDRGSGPDGQAVMGACSLCGRPAPAADHGPDPGPDDGAAGRGAERTAVLSTWTTELDPRRGAVLICPDCTREHLRSIEARLDQEWW